MTAVTTDGEPLPGGMANAGAVRRRGDVVVRPAPPGARALHAHLHALRRAGFDGVPAPVRLTDEGQEELSFVPGDVALPPFPDWVLTDTALESVGRLLRRLHDASATVPVDASADWSRELSDPEGGPLLCHNDVCPENVVFTDGRAAALIDFDMAAPGRPIWDLAMTARYWVPMLDPDSATAAYPRQPEPFARLRLLADAYRLSWPERAALPLVIEQATDVCRAFVAARVGRGDPGYLAALARNGGWERWDRLRAWLAGNRERFAAALTE